MDNFDLKKYLAEGGLLKENNPNAALISQLEDRIKSKSDSSIGMYKKYDALKGDSEHDVLFFNEKGSDGFEVAMVTGHGLSSKFMQSYGLRPTQSWVAGVDTYVHDGNYNPISIDLDDFEELVNHFLGGLGREAKNQGDFYKDRGRTSGTID